MHLHSVNGGTEMSDVAGEDPETMDCTICLS